MKKTALLLVLALLLQILLPPSMAGNVCAASTEEVAQTQAADGDQLKSLYDTYYLGACKKTGDYDHLYDGYEVKLYLRTSDDSLQSQEADAFKATIGGKEYAVGEVTRDYTLYDKDDYDYYAISVPILDDVSGTKGFTDLSGQIRQQNRWRSEYHTEKGRLFYNKRFKRSRS